MADTQTLNVTQAKLPGSQISLEVEIPPQRSQQAYEQVVKKFMRSANVPGFRRGKVPRQVILQRFGTGQLKAAALEDLIQSTFEAAVKQEDIEALGGIQLQSSLEDLVAQFQPGEALTYTVSVEVTPDITLKRHQDFEVTAEETRYDPAKVDEVLAQQQSQQATLVPVEERAAQKGDVVQIDFTSQFEPLEDEENPPETEELKDFQLDLGGEGFIPGLVDGVMGMEIGATKEIPITFPDTFFQEEWAGRTATFTVTLNDIKEKELPELDDDFAQDVSEFETLAELRTFLEERYQKEAQDETDASIADALITALVAELEVELPTTMIKEEVNALINETAIQLQSQGIPIDKLITKETLPAMQERFQPDAIQRLKKNLALAEVAEKENLTVEAEALEARYQEVAKDFGDRKFDEDRLRDVLGEELLQAKVIEWLKAHSQVTLVPAGTDSEEDSPFVSEAPAATQDIDVTAEVVTDDPSSPEPAAESNSTAEPPASKAKKTRTRKPKNATAADETEE